MQPSQKSAPPASAAAPRLGRPQPSSTARLLRRQASPRLETAALPAKARAQKARNARTHASLRLFLLCWNRSAAGRLPPLPPPTPSGWTTCSRFIRQVRGEVTVCTAVNLMCQDSRGTKPAVATPTPTQGPTLQDQTSTLRKLLLVFACRPDACGGDQGCPTAWRAARCRRSHMSAH